MSGADKCEVQLTNVHDNKSRIKHLSMDIIGSVVEVLLDRIRYHLPNYFVVNTIKLDNNMSESNFDMAQISSALAVGTTAGQTETGRANWADEVVAIYSETPVGSTSSRKSVASNPFDEIFGATKDNRG